MDGKQETNIEGRKFANKSGLTEEWEEFLSLYYLRNEEFNNDYKLHSRFHRRSKSGWKNLVSGMIRSIKSFFINESFIGIKYLKLAKWSFSSVICDLFCGLAEAALSIPQGLSYSSLANVLPSMGLCNGILQPIIYLFIGSSLYVSIGVNSVESIVAGSAVDSLVGSIAPLNLRSEVCSLLIFFHGVTCCLLRIFGLAHFVDFLSDSVLQGFLSGVAFSIIVKELPFMFAIEPPQTNCVPVRALFITLNKISNISWQATLFSISTILFLESIIWIKFHFNTNFPIPSQLIIIIIANIASALTSPDIPMIGLIPKSSLLIPNNLTWSSPSNVFIQPSNLSSLPFFARAWIAALPLTFISFFTHYSTAQSMEIRSQKNIDSENSREFKRKANNIDDNNNKDNNVIEGIDNKEIDNINPQKKKFVENQGKIDIEFTNNNHHHIYSTSTSSSHSEFVQKKNYLGINFNNNLVEQRNEILMTSQGDIDATQELKSSDSEDSSIIEKNKFSLNIRFDLKSIYSNSCSSNSKIELNSEIDDSESQYFSINRDSIDTFDNNFKKSPENIDFINKQNPIDIEDENQENSDDYNIDNNNNNSNNNNNNNNKRKYVISRSLFSVGTEILVLGLINIVGAFFNCLPGAASLARTNLNYTLGVKSPLHNVAYSLGVLIVAMFLLEYIRFLPEAVLGAIITQAMIRMVNIRYFIKLVKMRSIDSFFWVIAFIGTVTTGIIYGIIFALVSSIIYLIKFLYRPKFEVLGKLPGTLLFKSVEKFPQAVQLPYVRIARFEGPLTFINAERFVRNLETMVEVWLEGEDLNNSENIIESQNSYDCISRSQYFPTITSSINFGERIPTIIQDLNDNHVERVIIIDACMINEIDYTALQILQRFNNQAKKLNIQLWFASFSHPNSSFLLRSGFYDIIPLVHCFVDLSEAVAAAQICIGQKYSRSE